VKPLRYALFSRLSLAALFTLTTASLHADTIYWDGSTNNSWGNLLNWSTVNNAGSPDPAAIPGAANTAAFAITGLTYPRTVNLDGNRSVNGISTTGTTGLVTLTGGGATARTLTIGAGGISHLNGGLTIGSSGDEKVSILLSASQTWDSSTAGSGSLQAINIFNDVSAASAGLKTLTLTGLNTGTQIRGGITDGVGTVGITKSGTAASIWELQGVNTYSGATIVESGFLRLTGNAAASAASTFSVADGATLALKTAGATSGFTAAEIESLAARVNFASSAARLGLDAGNGNFTYDRNFTGNFTLNKVGGGVVTLSGANTHTGGTIISEGGIAFANDAAITAINSVTVASNAYLTVGGGVTDSGIASLLAKSSFAEENATFGFDTGAGNRTIDTAITWSVGLAKTGGNTLTLAGNTSNTYTGLTHMVGGSLDLNKSGGAIAITGGFRISGGTVNLRQHEQIADSATVNMNGGTFNFEGKNETINQLTLNNNAKANTGGGGVANVGAFTRTGWDSKLTINSGGKVIARSVVMSGDKLGIDGTGGGSILIGGNGAGSLVTELTITGGLTMTNQAIQVNSAAANVAGTRITLGGNYTGNGANEIMISGNTLTLAEFALTEGDHTFQVNNSGSGASLVAGITKINLNVAGAGNITKTGAGSLELSGNNTYTGTTQVNGGYIDVLHANALGSTLGGTRTSGGSVRLNGGMTVTGEALTIGGVGLNLNSDSSYGLISRNNNVWNGTVTMDVSNGSNARIKVESGLLEIRGDVVIKSTGTNSTSIGLVFTGPGGNGLISGVISGDGNSQNLIKNNAGELTLTANNLYTGHTRVDDGILNVASIAENLGKPTASNSAIQLGEATTTGTLRYTGAGETTNRGIRLRADSGGNGVIEQAGTGALVFTGSVSGSNSTTDKTLTLKGSTSGTGELTGEIIDNDGISKTHLVKSGTGTWTLSGSEKDYEGTTTVSGGTLNVTTALAQSTAIIVNDGTFVIGTDNVIKDDATVNLGEGAVLQIADFADAAGVLAVTGSAQLQLTGGTSILTFADSSAADWTGGALAITGWAGLDSGDDQIIFESTPANPMARHTKSSTNGLTAQQLAAITFVNPAGLPAGIYSAEFLGEEIVPGVLIPEPSAIAAFLVGGAGLLVRRRRA
jgi:fibronectin-binding autotransporter adhesin